MKKILAGITVAVALLFGASSASAFSIALDVPVQYNFDEGGSADEISGFKLGLGLLTFAAFDLGLGYESYELTEEVTSTEDATITFDIFDVFIDIPLPIVNIVLGYGTGEAEWDLAGNTETGNVSQAWISLGLPITPLFDVHVGYHAVDAEEIDTTISGFPVAVDVSGEMWSVGAKLGF